MNIWGPHISGTRFLDLFAGSGVVGFEAMSRGAASLVQVESDLKALVLLERNRQDLGLEQVQIVSAQLTRELSRSLPLAKYEFDLIFADPPYAFAEYPKLLAAISGYVTPAGIFAVEHDRRTELPAQAGEARQIDQRQYGDSCLSFYCLSNRGQG